MKKKFNNKEIEAIVKIMNDQNSFLNTVKMPQQMRHVIRVDREIFINRYNIFVEGRKEIVNKYVSDGFARKEDDMVYIDEPYRNAVGQELNELANADNELDIEVVDTSIMDAFLNNHELTMAEEDFLLMLGN